MEMAQIRYVLAAAKHLNFTRAAADCNVTQPALTKGIKTLEEDLGAVLFHREGRRVMLSDFGRSMLPHLRHIVEEADTARVIAQNFRLLEKVPIRLGVMSTIGHLRLSRFLARFDGSHKGLELAVSEGSVADLTDRLGNGQIDLAIMTRTDALAESFRTQPLYAERYVVVFCPDHRLARLNAVTLRDLSGEPYVDRLACEMREMVMQTCAQRDVTLYARFRSEREDWVQAMVLAGIGFAFMPEYSVTLPGLVQRPLAEPAVERQVCTVTMPGRRHSPAVDAFLRATRRFAWPG